jgi:Right handed beta helix region
MTKTLAITILLLGACSKTNPYYCEGHPDNNCLIDAAAGPDTPGASCANMPCVSGVCDTTTKTCVQCTAAEPGACMGTTPVCGMEDTCTACATHDQCTVSNACLPSGACGDDTNVAYVTSMALGGMVNTACTKQTPCTTVAAALATGRSYIKITGTISENVAIASGTVTLLAAPGAKLTGASAGVILTVSGSANVTIYDLDIYSALGAGVGDGIALSGSATLTLHRATVDASANLGVTTSAGTSLTVDRSTISNNTAGGLDVHGAFDIQNSFVVENGNSSAAAFGGISIYSVNAGTRTIAFTTIANNGGANSAVSGIVCSLITTPVVFSNNIVYNNANMQVADPTTSKCGHTYSDIGPDTVTNTGNLNLDPGFVQVGMGNFHLSPSSMLADKADPAANVMVDFDGNPRPQGLHSDIGADEIMP